MKERANRIRAFRADRRPFLTQDQLAAKTGLSQTRISLIENEHVEPTPAEMKAIARALHASVEDIFGPQDCEVTR